MPDTIENTVGLQHCYWSTNGKLAAVTKGGTYYLYTRDKNEFIVDESCVGGKTANPKYTADHARWAFIYDLFFQSLEKAKPEDIKENLWGPLSGGTIPVYKYGLEKKYKVGRSLKFNPSEGSYYFGHKQRVELFSESPGTGFYFYIVPVTSSKINYAYFHKSEDIKHYGENVSLTVMFHGYNLEKKNKYKAKVYLLEETEAIGLTQTEDFEDKNLWDAVITDDLSTTGKDDDFNHYLKHNFNINIDWKKGENRKKNFTVAVEVYRVWEERGVIYGTNAKEERVAFKNYADTPTTDLINYNAELLKTQDVDKKDSISSRFMVSEELMDHYLTRIEQDKKNMIQYIGDIEHTQREFDPCGYSKITIQDKGDSERKPLVIFDETQPANKIDKTEQIFAIIAGDERKEITITLDGLQTKNQFCQGLLLDEGQKHTQDKNVFQVDNVYSAFFRGEITTPDSTHQQQQKDAGIPTTVENSKDTDVIITDNVSNPSEAQQWQDGIDYKIEKDNEITLKLRYLYNKTAFESLQQINNNSRPEDKSLTSLNMLWLFRYFIFSDNLAQIFFLPISTCRYPNQIAKFRVYPDIEWEIAFMITIGAGYSGKIKYHRDRLNRIHLGDENNPGYGFRYIKDDLKIEGEKTENLGWTLKAKAIENGTEHEIGIESVKKVVDTAVYAFNITRQSLEVFDPSNSDGTPSLAVSRRIIEVDFAIDPPNVGFALSWKFGKASNDEIVPIYTGGLRADPLIGLTIVVDLVPLIKFIPYVGKILDWLIRFVEKLTKSKIYITFEISVPIKADLSLSYNRIDGFANRGKQKMWFEPTVTLRAGCKSNEVVFIPTATRADGTVETTETEKWKVEGNAAASYTFEKEWGYDLTVNKYYEQSSVKFNGAKITIIVSELISKRRIDFKPYKQETFEVVPPDKPDEPTYSSGKIYIEEDKKL